jgi:transcription elongation factor GreA
VDERTAKLPAARAAQPGADDDRIRALLGGNASDTVDTAPRDDPRLGPAELPCDRLERTLLAHVPLDCPVWERRPLADDVHEDEPQAEACCERRSQLCSCAASLGVAHAADDRPAHPISSIEAPERPARLGSSALTVAADDPVCDGGLTPFRRWVPDPIHGARTARHRALIPAQRTRRAPSTGDVMNETLITPAGLARLNGELERLQTVGRQEIADRLQRAVATDADVTANTDYLIAREEQALLEAKIARLQQRLDAIQVAEPDLGNDVLDLGERVRLRDLDTGTRVEYELVGSLEADLLAGRISVASPLGQAIIGRRKGEIALVDTPRGQFRFKILAIEPTRAVA